MEHEQAEWDRAELVRGIRNADSAVLDRLIDEHQHRLFRYLLVLSGNQGLAEDLFQETWLRVLERGAQYDGRWRFEAWLFTIARNLLIDHVRRKKAASLDELMDPDEGSHRFEPAAGDASALDQVLAGEAGERVARALARLPPTYREVLLLRFEEDLALADIAKVVSVPLSTAKSRLYRGLEALRSVLEKSG
jgi:RNA polymerase sigma-70 factor, ECF subfamily